jgi:predicted DNA-binding protein
MLKAKGSKRERPVSSSPTLYFGIDVSQLSFKEFRAVSSEVRTIIEDSIEKVEKENYFAPRKLSFLKWLQIKMVGNDQERMIESHKLAADKLGSLFERSFILQEILSEQQLETLISEVKAYWIKKGIEEIKKTYPGRMKIF